MKIAWGLLLISLTLNATQGQVLPVQVGYTPAADNSCHEANLGSGFSKSGMVQYVARPVILHSKWSGDDLSIRIFVVSDCCPPDYLGYVVKSDTLILYYGDKKSVPQKYGSPAEIDICMCGHNGCCYEFEYNITGLNQKINYLVKISDVVGIGLAPPRPIGYVNGREKSIYYHECDSLSKCLSDKIDAAISYYKKLGLLYGHLIDLHTRKSIGERKVVDEITGVWINYFSCREAIYDEFIKSRLDPKYYKSKVAEFEFAIADELELLNPKLEITNIFLRSGAFVEDIKEQKGSQR